MSKRVFVIASGETERLALPILLAHLAAEGITLQGVRIPPRHQDITPRVAEKLICGIYWELHGTAEAPDKFVILKDTDGKRPDEVLRPFEGISGRLGFPTTIVLAYAQQHLESWFFADAPNLRAFLHADLGKVDTSRPDEIENPKLHLKKLLGGHYSRFTAEDLARAVDPQLIRSHSPSFQRFLDAMRNGPRPAGAT